ncbi:MAG: hypothetical protein WDO73_21755 [Ignavibacteriota bacterium]
MGEADADHPVPWFEILDSGYLVIDLGIGGIFPGILLGCHPVRIERHGLAADFLDEEITRAVLRIPEILSVTLSSLEIT